MLWRTSAVLILCVASTAVAAPGRFFFSGDGTLTLAHGHFRERIQVRYRDAAGHYDPQGLARVQHFFRSRDNGEEGDVSLRLIELIDYVQDQYHPKQTVLLSGYRSPELNAALRANGARAAKSSLHSEGMAADLQFVGVDLRKMWVSLRERHIGGVGYYHKEGFLHLDTGKARFWEPQTSRVEEDISKGNARLFGRTDFDRYDNLQGAVIRLHSLTLVPVRIARIARVGDQSLTLEPASAGIAEVDGCYEIADPAAAYRLRVTKADNVHSARSTAIHLATCAPRLEATPEEFETNPIDIQAPNLTAR